MGVVVSLGPVREAGTLKKVTVALEEPHGLVCCPLELARCCVFVVIAPAVVSTNGSELELEKGLKKNKKGPS